MAAAPSQATGSSAAPSGLSGDETSPPQPPAAAPKPPAQAKRFGAARKLLDALYRWLAFRADKAFARACIASLGRSGEHFDVVISTYGPAGVHTVARRLKRLRRKPLSGTPRPIHRPPSRRLRPARARKRPMRCRSRRLRSTRKSPARRCRAPPCSCAGASAKRCPRWRRPHRRRGVRPGHRPCPRNCKPGAARGLARVARGPIHRLYRPIPPARRWTKQTLPPGPVH